MKLPSLVKGQAGGTGDKLSLCTFQPENRIQMQQERNCSKKPLLEVWRWHRKLERSICI